MKRIIRILLVILCIAAIVGGYLYYRSRTATTASASSSSSYRQVAAVKQGSISATISKVGSLEAVQSAELSFEHVSGSTKLQSLDVKAGNTVTTGQVLATIDPATYQQAYDQAKSDLAAAEETLADLQTVATTLEIAQADSTIAQAEASLRQAETDLADLKAPDLVKLQNAVRDAQDNLALLQLKSSLAEHDSLAKSERDLQYSVSWHERRIAQLQKLVASGEANAEEAAEVTTEQESLAKAETSLAQVQAERELNRLAKAAELVKDQVALADAQDALAKALAGGDKVTLAQAELAVTNAQVTLDAAKEAKTELLAGTDATAIAKAQAAVDKKRLALSEAQAALAGTTLVAPFDGTILKTNASAGDLVSANTKVVSMANLKTLRVVASIDEITIKNVSAGQPATITFDAYAGQTFTGTVQSVPLQGALQGGVAVYEVPISLNGAERLSLLVGMTANVKISVGEAKNALLVPTLALQKASGLYQVLVPTTSDTSGATEAVPVEVGLSDGTYTQIIKGLNAGDHVVYTVASTSSSSTNRNSSSSMFGSFTRLLGGR